MDKERQLYGAEKYPSSSGAGWKVLAVITTVISIVSLLVAVAALTLVHIQTRPADDTAGANISQREVMQVSYAPVDTQRKAELLKNIALTLKAHDKESSLSRQARRTKANCNSPLNGDIPLAHIAATGIGEKTLSTAANAYPVLSAKWSCDDSASGSIKGGMSYNPTTGFLKVPVDGAYFLYSQIIVRGATQALGHSTVLCKCAGKADCVCTTDDSTSSNSKTSSAEVQEFMQGLQSGTSDVSSNYHGGIRQLKAGDQIALIPPVQYSGSYTYLKQQTKAFFGAFLVSKLPEKEPVATPSPSPSSSPSQGK